MAWFLKFAFHFYQAFYVYLHVPRNCKNILDRLHADRKFSSIHKFNNVLQPFTADSSQFNWFGKPCIFWSFTTANLRCKNKSNLDYIRPGPPRGGGQRDHCPGARGSKLSGLECKIHQLKLRPADAMMLFFLFRAEIRTSVDAMTLFCSSLDVEPKFKHLRRLWLFFGSSLDFGPKFEHLRALWPFFLLITWFWGTTDQRGEQNFCPWARNFSRRPSIWRIPLYRVMNGGTYPRGFASGQRSFEIRSYVAAVASRWWPCGPISMAQKSNPRPLAPFAIQLPQRKPAGIFLFLDLSWNQFRRLVLIVGLPFLHLLYLPFCVSLVNMSRK